MNPEFEKWFDFIGEVMSDSPHSCNEKTWDWYERIESQIKRVLVAAAMKGE